MCARLEAPCCVLRVFGVGLFNTKCFGIGLCKKTWGHERHVGWTASLRSIALCANSFDMFSKFALASSGSGRGISLP